MSRKNPMVPDKQHGYCSYTGRLHRHDDMTLNGKREPICRYCDQPWKGEK